jgi:hypothetical protein
MLEPVRVALSCVMKRAVQRENLQKLVRHMNSNYCGQDGVEALAV